MGLFTRYTNKTDEALMILIQNGDHRAFNHLYDRYAGRLKGYFVKMLWNNHEAAEDHVHDLFTRIIDRPGLYNPEYRVKSWLFQIASNMCKNTYRKHSFEVAYCEQLEEQGILMPTIETRLDETLQLDTLYKTLDKMEAYKKDLFLLRYQQELSIKELAELLDVPEGTVKSKLYYVKKELLKAIHEDEKARI